MRNRLFILLIAVCMTVSMLPQTVLAEETQKDVNNTTSIAPWKNDHSAFAEARIKAHAKYKGNSDKETKAGLDQSESDMFNGLLAQVSINEAVITPRRTPAPSAQSSLTKQSFQSSSGTTLAYWLYTPKRVQENMPMIVYLHGRSGKGNDLDILMQNDGFPLFLKNRQLGNVPAYIIIPQLTEAMQGWTDVKKIVYELIHDIVETYHIDSSRIGLTGHSLGGTGTWNLALAYPNLFSRVAPLSGSIRLNETNISAFTNLSVWALVGSADNVISPDSSIQFIEKLQAVNENAKITVFDDADHFTVPSLAYLDQQLGLINWLLQKN